MERALELARRGRGRVAPNPLVGAVIVRDGRAVGEGWHAEFGAPHAEVVALEAAGEAARGATLYATLEPCRHHGKTPPCTEAIREAGIARVVVACRDPEPTAGGGGEELRAAGVRVDVGAGAAEARRLNAPFLWARVADRPFVTLKYALSLDSRIARREGERTPVTGEEAAAWTHGLRAGQEAILVGRRTVEVDDPLLTARGDPAPREPPARVVLDTGLRLPRDARLVRTADTAPTWVVAGADAPEERRRELESRGVRVLDAPVTGPGRLDLAAVARRLRRDGVEALLVEGGARVGRGFVDADLVDRLALVRAPVVFGAAGVDAFPGDGAVERGRWRTGATRRLGEDHLWVLERRATFERLREIT